MNRHKRPMKPMTQWRARLPILGIGFAAGALTLAAVQGQFSGGTRLSVPAGAVRSGSRVFRPEPTIQPASPADRGAAASGSVATSGAAGSSGALVSGDVAALRMRGLDVPVDGIARAEIPDNFRQARGSRVHEAVDILAPRHTPVHAVEDGTIARLFFSKAGGITIYQFDPAEQFCYYYAHLERYADGLTEGQSIRRGQVIGYVGTSGNAPRNTPHLHFAIFRLNEDKKWWDGDAVDPFLVFKP